MATKKKNAKVSKVMKEFKAGKLKSSNGSKVANPRQAMAIALSEAKKSEAGGGKRKSPRRRNAALASAIKGSKKK